MIGITMNSSNYETLVSSYPFDETVKRLQTAFKSKNMTIFAVIDHQAAAKAMELEVQPATVIVFGNPKAGTPLMIQEPKLALKLPLKVLITETGGVVQVVFETVESLIADTVIRYDMVEKTLGVAGKLIEKSIQS